MNYIDKLFNLKGKLAIVIGSGGHLCSEISKGLFLSGVHLILLDIRKEKNDVLIKSIKYGKEKFIILNLMQMKKLIMKYF